MYQATRHVDHFVIVYHALATTAIHIVPDNGRVFGPVDSRFPDVDDGIAIYLTCRLACLAFVDSGEQTAGATIHIAVKSIVISGSGIGIVCITDDAAFNVDKGILSHMAVLAATKRRAVNLGRLANGHMGVFDEGQINILAAHAAVA